MGIYHKHSASVKPVLTVAALLIFLLAFGAVDRGDAAAPSAFVKAHGMVIYGPKPDYPYEALQKGKTGAGVAVVAIDPSGRVTDVIMARSTGHEVLDRSAVSAFRDWRFKPGTPDRIKIPITFGPRGQVITEIREKSRSMAEVLAPVLGPGALLFGPSPKYPAYPPWMDRNGKGVYELHVDRDGKVTDVKILKSSGDATFDRVSVSTLRKWRLRTGPKVIELPLAFRLTPTSYSVGIP